MITLTNVFVIFKRHTAFEAALHFLHFVLEALEGFERAFVDHDVIAKQAHFAAALDNAIGDHTSSDFSGFADGEYFADFGVAQEVFLECRREHTR